MNAELTKIIALFNDAQERAVEILENKFNCPRPESSDDFIFRCVPLIRDANYEKLGFKIRPHGIGMELLEGSIKIDFDFGENGEINGFDAYRLFNFIILNKLNSHFKSENDIVLAINEAIDSGAIIQSKGMGSNCYVGS